MKSTQRWRDVRKRQAQEEIRRSKSDRGRSGLLDVACTR